MVIGREFAWGHLPKTAGDATLSLFSSFANLILFADPVESYDKHDSFRTREAEVRGKLLALNIRRLPSWTLSLAHHKAQNGLYPEFVPLPLDSPDEMAKSTFADDLLRDYIDPPIDRWLRVESLAADFLAFISEFTELTPEIDGHVHEAGRVNALSYDHDLFHWFRRDQIERMYESNPIWSAIEEEVYSGLLV